MRRVWLDLRAGFDFLFHHAAVLFVVLAMASGIFAIGCFGPLIAVHVRDNLHAGTTVFSAASALIGLGIFVGITFLRGFASRFTHTQVVFTGLGGMAIFVAILGSTFSIPVTLLCCMMTGLFVSAVIVPAQTLLQTETPPHLLGRVGSTVMSTVFGAQIVGLLLSGELARLTSIRQVFWITSVTLLVLMAAGRLFLSHRTGTTTYPDAAVPKT
jgi:DHA3 family macrolide efflux protein-like MFS transporter